MIELGRGQHSITSVGRFDQATFTSGSSTVADSSITSQDVGKYVISYGVNQSVVVGSVIPGVSFTLDDPTSGALFNATRSGTLDTLITTPGLILPNGVMLRGRGSAYTNTLVANGSPVLPAVTEIVDNGTGISIMVAHPTTSQTGMTAYGSRIERLTLTGNANNAYGIYVPNQFRFTADTCDIRLHGVAGVVTAENVNHFAFRDCRFFGNGTVGSTRITGGALLESPLIVASTEIAFDNCFFVQNNGFGICRAGVTVTGGIGAPALGGVCGIIINGSSFNGTHATAFSGSGVHAVVGDSSEGRSSLLGCWFEGAANYNLNVGPGPVTVIDCMFNTHAADASAYGIVASGILNLIGCYFGGNATASVSTSQPVSWMGCATTDPEFIIATAVTPTMHVPAGAAIGMGAIGTNSSPSGLTTAPATATSVALTSGTAWQNTLGFDCIIAVPVTFTSGGTAAVARGRASTPTAMGTDATDGRY